MPLHGAERAAWEGVGSAPPGPPSLFYLSGGTEFRRHEGFGPTAQNAWTAQSAAPPSAGPPKRPPQKSPRTSVRGACGFCLLVQLDEAGQVLVALLGGPTPPGRGPPGPPSLFYLPGGTEFHRHRGFGPTAQSTWTAQSAAPPSAGPPKRPPYKTGPGRFVRGPCASLFTCRAPPVW